MALRLPPLRFRDKLLLGFAALLGLTFIPLLFLVNTQVDTISEAKIAEDLQSARRVFQRFQATQAAAFSERASAFILTQPEIRAEVVTFAQEHDDPFANIFDAGEDPFMTGEGEAADDPFMTGDAEAEGTADDPFMTGEGEAADDPFMTGDAEGEGAADDPFMTGDAEGDAAADDPFMTEEAEGGEPSADDPFMTGEAEGGPPATREGLPEPQSRVLSVLQELALYRDSGVFLLTDYQGRVVFNKADPAMSGENLSGLQGIYAALQGNEVFTWWGSRDPALAKAGVLPATETPALYQMLFTPITFGGEVKGVMGIGTAVSEAIVTEITSITQARVAFVAGGHVYQGSPPASLNRQLAEALETPAPGDAGEPDAAGEATPAAGTAQAETVEPTEDATDGPRLVEIDTEPFLALPVPVSSTWGDPVGRVIVYRSKAQEMAVYENLKRVLTVIGVVGLAVAAVLAGLISFNVARAVRALTQGVREVQGGNLDHRVSIRSRDEFGTLSAAFNEMTAGLKEKETIRDTFRRYVSSSVVDELLKNADDVRLGGESKLLTIQFSDIAGFTALSEPLAPEGVVAFLNQYLSEMTAAIEAEGGVVDKYVGDAVMAFWGAPIPQADHALRACRAALAQVARVAELRHRWSDQGDLSRFRARLGLHTGEVIVGNVGSDTRMDYTIIGDAVNTASRLEGINKVYGTDIVISEHTARAVEGRMIVRELDLIRPVGKARPVRIYELAGEVGRMPEGERAPWEAKATRFSEALAAYREGRFAEAKCAFAGAAEAGDPAAAPFVARCDEYLAAAPPEPWDGVYQAVGK